MQHQQVSKLSWMQSTAHSVLALLHLTHNNTAQPSNSALTVHSIHLCSKLPPWVPANSQLSRTADLLFLCVHFAQERLDLSIIKGKITRKQNNCNTESRRPTPQLLIVPSALPSAFLHSAFWDGHLPFVFLSTATGFLVSAVSNSS